MVSAAGPCRPIPQTNYPGGIPVRRGPAVILLFVLMLGAAFGVQRATTFGWQRVAGFAPAHFGAKRPATGSPPLANRMVLLMVDGLRVEDALLLPSLDWLRRQGAGYRLTVPPPGYQVPVGATLLTGAEPRHHGLLLDTPQGPLRADNLVDAAIRAKLSVGAIGTPALGTLLKPAVANWQDLQATQRLAEQALPLLGSGGPRLVLIQVDRLHKGIHDLKTASRDSADYRKLLSDLDTDLVELMAAVDLKTTSVVVTGTVPTAQNGGHPAEGRVPLIMAGAGVKTGDMGEASLLDVAPTVAALLGTPMPLANSGRPLTEALRVEARAADLLSIRALWTRKAFTDVELQALGAGEFAPDPPTTVQEIPAWNETVSQQLRAARLAHWKAGALERLPYVGGILLALVLYLVLAFRQPFGGALFLGVLTYGAVYHLLYFLTGGRYSATMAGLESLDRHAIAAMGLRSAVAMTAACLVGGFSMSRRGFKYPSYMTAAALHLSLVTAAVGALPVVIAVGLIGWQFPVELPAAGLLIWYFITGLQVVVIGYMSPVWAAITVFTCRTAQRLWPLKEIGDPELNADKTVRVQALKRSKRPAPGRRSTRPIRKG